MYMYICYNKNIVQFFEIEYMLELFKKMLTHIFFSLCIHTQKTYKIEEWSNTSIKFVNNTSKDCYSFNDSF